MQQAESTRGQARGPQAHSVKVPALSRRERICVLPRGGAFTPRPPGVACRLKNHSHACHHDAVVMVESGQAEWVTTAFKRTDRREPAIRMLPRRTWRAMPSGGTSVKVMQLVG